jgi:hypothetical protein
MNVSGASTGVFAAQTRNGQVPQRPAGASTSQSYSPEASQSAGSMAGSPLLSHVHVLSSVHTTLPNGDVLAVFRFDLGSGGLDTSQPAPTAEDKSEDAQMLSALKQMASYLNDYPTAAEIRLGGTAAVDLTA